MPLGFLYLLLFCACAVVVAAPPPTKRIDHVDELHGAIVPDPYRWLEDVDSPDTRAWVQAQSTYARRHLDTIPGREKLRERITELMNYTRSAHYEVGARHYAGILKSGGRLFFLRQDGGQNQPVLYVQEGNSEPRALINPNTASKEGITALATWAPSPDGKRLAYGIAVAGSDWQEWRVRDVDTGKDLPGRIQWIKFANPVWSPDGKGVYYSRYPEPAKDELLTAANYNNKLYYHRLGTKQTEDKLIYERPDRKEWRFDPWPSEDGRYLLILVSEGTAVENMVFYQDLRAGNGKTVELIRDFSGMFSPLGNRGTEFYFQSTEKAPKGHILSIDFANPDRSQWKQIVPEGKDALELAVWSGGRLYCQYLEDVKSAVRVYGLQGRFEKQVKLPGMGTAAWYAGSRNEPEQFYSFAGFTSPLTLYRYDANTGESHPLFSSKLPFDPSIFETKQVFYQSKDGTKIPMFLSYRKGLRPNGANPTILYGYGGFSIAIVPNFSVLYLAWMEQGGLVAVANLRGGSEYGEAWHHAGMKQNKQNVFDDFIAAGEWLIANNYTSSHRLSILGGSNGGLLVGACLNQRPDLFGAAIPMVGVMDMLRFHKFTIGKAWTSDYGDPANSTDFEILHKYSPLQNIRQGSAYPATMIMTADHDDRVVPAHSFKYGAALQYAQEGKAPILIRIQTSAGHGAGKPAAKMIEEYTDMISFLRQALRM
ncbi:MAG: S9 family peptidase [Bryobacterales bacterium]|nr:S9 family peptidase [Bryobacterales bacterium]